MNACEFAAWLRTLGCRSPLRETLVALARERGAASAVRELVVAIADTPLVHELAVAADLAQQDGRTTHEQTRHPGDAALLDELLRDVDIGFLESSAIPEGARARLKELTAGFAREQTRDGWRLAKK